MLLVYQLNSNPTLQEAAIAVGKELDLPVVRLEYWQTFRGRGAHTLMRPSVEEFVALIRDACVLVSDSFHGAAFALNLDTLLVSIRPPTYRGRLDSPPSQFELEALRASSVDQAVQIVREHGTLPDRAARLAKGTSEGARISRRNVGPSKHGHGTARDARMSTLKEKLGAISPRWLVRTYRHLATVREFARDCRDYNRSTLWRYRIGTPRTGQDERQAPESRLTLAYHGIEKGASFPLPKRPYGSSKIPEINELLGLARASDIRVDSVERASTALGALSHYNATVKFRT